MRDDRAFIAQVEAADPAEFAEILQRVTAEEGRLLRLYFGDERFTTMRGLALQRTTRAVAEPLGNVVVLPGVMGSELATYDARDRGDRDLLWVSYLRLLAGQIGRLRLGPDGTQAYDRAYQVEPIGVMKKYYGELILGLYRRWNVRAFFYDWRKDIDVAANALRTSISGWFGEDAPVHLVAHSLGGLVARAFIHRHPDRWQRMQDPEHGSRGGRLVMLGTPNRGSFAIVQTLVGIEGLIRQIGKLDLRHGPEELTRIINSFVATYQMLPTADGGDRDQLDQLYLAQTYYGFDVSQTHLDRARAFQDALTEQISFPEQLFYVAGANQPTLSTLPIDLTKLREPLAYGASDDGDGRVLHERGRWTDKVGNAWPLKENCYAVEEVHANLQRNKRVREAIDDLLESGRTDKLPHHVTLRAIPQGSAIERYMAHQVAADQEVERMARRLRPRGVLRGTTFVGRGPDRSTPLAPSTAGQLTSDEVRLRDLLVWGRAEDLIERDALRGPRTPGETPGVEIRLLGGTIEALDRIPDLGKVADGAEALAVDAIAVGHYLGVRPQAAELALDRAISKQLWGDEVRQDDYLLTQFTDRQTFLGELGRPFFLDDPRPGTNGRRLAIAGMGVPGRFGPPELTVLARELCWSLDRLGTRHLATILIGAGTGNIAPRDAVRGWLRGIELALRGRGDGEPTSLERVTFVIRNPDTLLAAHDAIVDEKEHLVSWERLAVDYDRYPEKGTDDLGAAKARIRDEFEQELAPVRATRAAAQAGPRQRGGPSEKVPTRLTVDLDGDRYRFGAITKDAAMPERLVPVTPGIVERANDELAQEDDPAQQEVLGHFMERFLLHEEIRPHLATDAPLVLLLEPRTARIHWEMIAQPDPAEVARAAQDQAHPPAEDGRFDRYRFLGTARGLTRQLRTTFAPPPEPPPPPRRRLRVLVVADPADDASLPGAEVEGMAVVELFEAYNRIQSEVDADVRNVVEIVHLSGPTEASLTNVLVTLMTRPFDVFHFAGHCFYRKEDPSASGYVFHADPWEALTARELNRVDRVPKFVFSNACESGVTQDRRDQRSVDLPPSFAEAFFARGVSNFVCTAWPIDDLAAQRFALTLYAWLLGLQIDEAGRAIGPAPEGPLPIHRAMQEARVALAASPDGARSWGAYQHYGNPFFRLFATESAEQQR